MLFDQKPFNQSWTFQKKSDLIDSFLTTGNVDIISSLHISPTNGKSRNGKSLMFNTVLHQVKAVLKGVSYQNKDNFQGLLVSIPKLLWYIGPHENKRNKFNSQTFPIPKFFECVCMFNDPERHKHDEGSIVKYKLNLLLQGITS